MPFFVLEVEKPDIIEVCKILSSKDDEVFANDLRNVICSLPRPYLIIDRFDGFPFFGSPIERVNRIEPFFALTSSSEENQSIIVFIVVESGIRPWLWYVSSGL